MAAQLFVEEIAKADNQELIILIDEPELHLHPQLQKSVYEHMRDSGFQTIYATHSDVMVSFDNWRGISRFTSERRVTPKTEKLETTFDEKSLSNHLDEIPKFFYNKTVIMREHNEVFFARKCLLVEGSNDKYGSPFLAEGLNSLASDDRKGEYLIPPDISIVSCGGKENIKQFLTICRAFEIPFFTVFDLDEDDDEENSRIRDLSSEDYFEFEPSFEKVLGIAKSRQLQAIYEKYEGRNSDIPEQVKSCIKRIIEWSQKVDKELEESAQEDNEGSDNNNSNDDEIPF